MDTVIILRQWAYLEAKAAKPTGTVAELITEAKKIEAYLDVNVNPDPKTLPKE